MVIVNVSLPEGNELINDKLPLFGLMPSQERWLGRIGMAIELRGRKRILWKSWMWGATSVGAKEVIFFKHLRIAKISMLWHEHMNIEI